MRVEATDAENAQTSGSLRRGGERDGPSRLPGVGDPTRCFRTAGGNAEDTVKRADAAESSRTRRRSETRI